MLRVKEEATTEPVWVRQLAWIIGLVVPERRAFVQERWNCCGGDATAVCDGLAWRFLIRGERSSSMHVALFRAPIVRIC